jgi:Bacterial Ig-like domain/Fibronectin type III domain
MQTSPLRPLLALLLAATMSGCAASQPPAPPTPPPLPPTDTTAPGVPNNLLTKTGDTQIVVSWTANTESDLKGYNLYQGNSASNLEFIRFVGKNSTSQTITELTNDTAYFFALSAEDTSGNASAKTAPLSATPKDSTPPSFVSSSPKNGTTGVSTELEAVSFSFNEPMLRGSIRIKCLRRNGSVTSTCGDREDGKFDSPVWNDDDRTVRFTRPGDVLTRGASYEITVLTARDKAGNPIAASFAIVFDVINPAP